MRQLHDVVLSFHIVAGFIALVAFWVPVATRKGGPTHRRVGWFYVAAMFVVVTTALVLAGLLALAPRAVRDFSGAKPEEIAKGVEQLRAFAVFFVALALLTASGGWHGLLVLRTRRRPQPLGTAISVGLHVLSVLIAPPLLALGLQQRQPLFGIFAVLCFLSGTSTLQKLWRPPSDPRDWLYEHLGGMIGTGIAAHTAFLAFGAVRLVPSLYALSPALYVIPWVAPTLIGVVAGNLLERRYRSKEVVSGSSAHFP